MLRELPLPSFWLASSNEVLMTWLLSMQGWPEKRDGNDLNIERLILAAHMHNKPYVAAVQVVAVA